jgi:hypothetical protein
VKEAAAAGAVLLYSHYIGFHRLEGFVSLGVGLMGVALARWVFVNREHRKFGRRPPWAETLPLTLVAMLVTGVIVHDRDLGLSAAAFTGLGVGWTAVVLLDLLGDRVIAFFRGSLTAGPSDPSFPPGHDGSLANDEGNLADLPPDMLDDLEKLDKEPGQ